MRDVSTRSKPRALTGAHGAMVRNAQANGAASRRKCHGRPPVWAASPADEWMSQTRKPAVPCWRGARPTNTVIAGLTWRSVGGGFATSTTEIFLCEVQGESGIYHNRRRPPPALAFKWDRMMSFSARTSASRNNRKSSRRRAVHGTHRWSHVLQL